MRREIGLNKISGQVVDVAMKVHTSLAPGLLENAFEVCRKHELEKKRIKDRTAGRFADQFQRRAAQRWCQTDGEQSMKIRNLLCVLCG